jgi:tRNA(Ile)-lysidine synthase
LGNSDIIVQATETIKKHSMLKGGETVLVGLSGGPDSVCLLTVLDRLKETFKLTLHAVYVDHNLRPGETPAEIAFCKTLCHDMKVDFRIKSIDVKGYVKEHGGNKQEAARDLRYRAFMRLQPRDETGSSLIMPMTRPRLSLCGSSEDRRFRMPVYR